MQMGRKILPDVPNDTNDIPKQLNAQNSTHFASLMR
jgi:hypothetical protein